MELINVISACSNNILKRNMKRAKHLYLLSLALSNKYGCNDREKESLEFLKQYFYDEHGNEIYFDNELNI